MLHRHLNPGQDRTYEAVEDVIARGAPADWRELARAVIDDPHGEMARILEGVLASTNYYGSTVLWKDWLARVRQRAGRT